MLTHREAARKTATAARTEVLNALKQDHRNVKKAFRAFEKLDPQTDADACRALVAQTCAELSMHVMLEEELFYPAVRNAIQETGLVDEAEVEHATAKSLMADLDQLPADSRMHAATFKVLAEYVQHHVKEEEHEVFPKLTRAKIDWGTLARDMKMRREALMRELLPHDAGSAGASLPAKSLAQAAEDERQIAALSSHDEDA